MALKVVADLETALRKLADSGGQRVDIDTISHKGLKKLARDLEREPGHFLRALSLLERHAAQVPWHAIGEKTYPLARVGEALVDAEAMRITKALVDPWGN